MGQGSGKIAHYSSKKEMEVYYRALLGFLGVLFFMLIFCTDDNNFSFHCYRLGFCI